MKHVPRLGQGLPDSFIEDIETRTSRITRIADRAGLGVPGRQPGTRALRLHPAAGALTDPGCKGAAMDFFRGQRTRPGDCFWKSFSHRRRRNYLPNSLPASSAGFCRGVPGADHIPPSGLLDLGFRILPGETALTNSLFPAWAKEFLVDDNADWDKLRYLLTFRPFGQLPAPVRANYWPAGCTCCLFPAVWFSGACRPMPVCKSNSRWPGRSLLRLVSRRAGRRACAYPRAAGCTSPPGCRSGGNPKGTAPA